MGIGLLNQKYLSDEQLERINHHKYKAVCNGPIIDYINMPFWNWFIEYHPKWIAPNVLTVFSLALITLPYLIVLYYNYNIFNGPIPSSGTVPRWVWIICAISSFWSNTYDAMDGMQARRTSSASAVGEFFDHALDVCKVLPFTMTLFAPFDESDSRISPLCSLILLIEILTTYTFAFWEQYITKVLHIRWCFEGLYVAHILHILAYFDGDNLVTAFLFGQWRICSIVLFILNVCCASNILFSLCNIYQFCVAKSASEKQQSMFYSIEPIIPVIELNVVALLWALFSPGEILSRDLPAFLFTITIINANVVSRLIISHMSNSHAQICNTAVMLYCFAALISMSSILSVSGELLLLKLLALLSFLAYIHHFSIVVQQMCAKLQIEVFSLRYLNRSNTRK